jgi:hypothetical protein
MTDNRMSGAALIAGMIGFIITMAFHPTGHDLGSPEHAAFMMRLNVAVHSLALVCIPILFLGALGLTKFLNAPNRLAVAGLVLFGFAEVAVMNAATVSGLIVPGVFHHMTAEPGLADTWRAVMQLCGHMNQAFALIFVVASALAIVLWSVAILRGKLFSRSLGLYGCILGPVLILVVVFGRLPLNVHAFGMITLVLAIWFIVAGVQLCQKKNEPTKTAAA